MPAIDPIESGFVKSLSRPGTNMTGISFTANVRKYGKQLEIFAELIPNLRSLVVLYDGRHPAAMISLGEIRKVAAYSKNPIVRNACKDNSGSRAGRIIHQKSRIDGIYLVCSSLFADVTKPAEIAKRRKMPFHACTLDAVISGAALFGYSRDFYAIGHRGAWYVNRLLKDRRPQDLPVETGTKFELAINLKTANAIGAKIPPEVLRRADEVIK
jgi:putative ABC transport system substrate-binding protein